jgi:hypothetical protein
MASDVPRDTRAKYPTDMRHKCLNGFDMSNAVPTIFRQIPLQI